MGFLCRSLSDVLNFGHSDVDFALSSRSLRKLLLVLLRCIAKSCSSACFNAIPILAQRAGRSVQYLIRITIQLPLHNAFVIHQDPSKRIILPRARL